MSRKKELIYFTVAAVLILIIGATVFFCEIFPFTDGPTCEGLRGLLFINMFLFMPVFFVGLIAILYIPVALIALFFVKNLWRLRLFLSCIVFGIAFLVAFLFMVKGYDIKWKARREACERISNRGNIIIQAIESYRKQEGKPPDSLEDLIPEYLDKIPGTGIRAYPYFEYKIPKDPYSNYEKKLYEEYNAVYELRVNFYRILSWDCFFYWPSERYPEFIYSGGTEIINKWAYVHE